jgi:hypothetical protein
MVFSIYHLGAILAILLGSRIILLYSSKYRVIPRLKSTIYDWEYPITKVKSGNTFPWDDEQSFSLILLTEDDRIYFDYGSTAEALDKLSNHYIQPSDDLSIPVEGAKCPVCGEIMNPLSGAEGFRNKPVGGVIEKKEPVNICISCSKDLRRDMVRNGTPTHSTAEIIASDWSELDTEVDFL